MLHVLTAVTQHCITPAVTLRNNDVLFTSKRRHFDVNTSKWRRFDVNLYVTMASFWRKYVKLASLWRNDVYYYVMCSEGPFSSRACRVMWGQSIGLSYVLTAELDSRCIPFLFWVDFFLTNVSVILFLRHQMLFHGPFQCSDYWETLTCQDVHVTNTCMEL